MIREADNLNLRSIRANVEDWAIMRDLGLKFCYPKSDRIIDISWVFPLVVGLNVTLMDLRLAPQAPRPAVVVEIFSETAESSPKLVFRGAWVFVVLLKLR